MIKEEVQGVVPPSNLEAVLATDEVEAFSEFEKEVSDVLNESPFKISLQHLRSERQKIEVVGVPSESAVRAPTEEQEGCGRNWSARGLGAGVVGFRSGGREH